MKFLLLLLFGAFCIPSAFAESKKVVCYWQRKIDASLLDPFACTHIVLAFVNTNPTTGEVFFVNAQQQEQFFKLRELRTYNHELKIMVSIMNYFPQISMNLRSEFANYLRDFVIEYEIDGVDIDWEYPTFAERKNFVLLLRELRKALQPIHRILSMAVKPCLFNDNHGYDVLEITKEVDFTTIMLYNMFGGSWNNQTANHGNLRHATSAYNVVSCVKTWVDAGAVNENLVLAIPTYSRNFQLDDPNNYGVGAWATFKDFGKPGEIPATYSYFQICQNINQNGWRRFYENVKSTGPFAVYDKIWAGYDDVESISEKAIFVNDGGYAGVAFWSLDHDDYSNSCGGGKFPLIRSVWNYFN